MVRHFRRAMAERVPIAFEAYSPILERWLDIRISPSGDELYRRQQTRAGAPGVKQHYRLLFDSNPRPIWLYDLETLRFLAVNAAAVSHYGFTRDQFLAMTIEDIRSPATVPALETDRQNAAPGLSRPGIQVHRKKGGITMQIEITSNDLLFAGRPAQMAANDVTARIQAEESLKLFRALMDRSRDSIEVIYRVTARVMDVNEQACVTHGYTREEYLKLTVFDLHIALPRADSDANQQRMKQREGIIIQGIHTRKDGTIFPTEVSLNWVSLDRDYPLAVVRDITERKQAEEALAAERSLLRTVIDVLPDSIYVKDAKGRFLAANNACARQLGAAGPAEVIGKSEADFHPSELAAQVRATERQILEGGSFAKS